METSNIELNNVLAGLQEVQGNNDNQQKVFSVIGSLIKDICGDPSFAQLTSQSQRKINILLKYLSITTTHE